MRREVRLVQLVEREAGDDGGTRGDGFDYGQPDVGEARLVGGAAVDAGGEGDGGCGPDDDGHGEVLQDLVPCPLGGVSWIYFKTLDNAMEDVP